MWELKEVKHRINPKENEPWIFFGRTDAEYEAAILWLSDAKRWLTGKDPDAGKDWRQEEKGATEDKMVGWHHWFSECEFALTPGDREGQGSLSAAVHGVTDSDLAMEEQQQSIESVLQRVSAKQMYVITMPPTNSAITNIIINFPSRHRFSENPGSLC